MRPLPIHEIAMENRGGQQRTLTSLALLRELRKPAFDSRPQINAALLTGEPVALSLGSNEGGAVSAMLALDMQGHRP